MLEHLETRRLLAVTFDPATATLLVAGTAGRDVIVVRQEAGELVVVHNGVRETVPVGGAAHVRVEGGAGRDRIHVEAVDLNLWVAGGRGNDHVDVGGVGGTSSLSGNEGRDRIFGGSGVDNIFGGAGSDTLVGRGGGDRIRGETGHDLVDGGDGDDVVYGDHGNDRLSGGAGNDRLHDVAGFNRYAGGEGTDEADVRSGARHRADDDVETVWRREPADPFVHAFVTRSAAGEVAVVVDAGHPAGGFRRTFHDLERTAGGFRIEVIGEDLVGPGEGRTLALEIETRTYVLGRLAPGSYEFLTHSGGRPLEKIQIGVTETGLTPETPTTPGPYHDSARPAG